MKFSSLAALKVVILTTFSAASDENFIKTTTFSFQWFSVPFLFDLILRWKKRMLILNLHWIHMTSSREWIDKDVVDNWLWMSLVHGVYVWEF